MSNTEKCLICGRNHITSNHDENICSICNLPHQTINHDNCDVRLAIENGHIELVKYLVSQGVDITANNNCAVRLASENGHIELVKYLVFYKWNDSS